MNNKDFISYIVIAKPDINDIEEKRCYFTADNTRFKIMWMSHGNHLTECNVLTIDEIKIIKTGFLD
jgi:hypothetical protein